MYYSYGHPAAITPLQNTPITKAIANMGYTEYWPAPSVKVDIFNLLLDSFHLKKNSFEKDVSPIIYAVGIRNIYCVEMLIEKGGRLDIISYTTKRYVWTHVAVMGNVELLKCMFNYGIDKDSTDQNGLSVLWWVVSSRNIEAVRYLLDLGVVIHSPKLERCKNNNVMIDINQEDQDPCIKAIRHNMFEIVKLFEEHGSKSCELFTALRCAVIYNSVDVASYLLKVRSVPEKWSIWPKHDKSIF